MPASKLIRIVDAVAARLAAITIANGYNTNIGRAVLRDRLEPGLEEMPCVLVVLGERSAAETKTEAARVDMLITVLAYEQRDNDSEAQGADLLADIQRAVETGDMTLGGLVRDQYGLTWQGDEIFMPEAGQNAVGARVVYSAPHVRKLGDPEIE